MIALDWQPLGAADAGRTVLAVDFAAGRRQAGFRELAANVDAGRVFLESVVTPHADPTESPDPAAVVRRWCDTVVDRGRPVDAVLGFCAGATLACALADRVAERTGSCPTVILLDPTLVGSGTLVRHFDEAVESVELLADDADPFAPPIDGDAIRRAMTVARATVARIAGSGTTSAGELVGAITAAHRTLVTSACAAADIEPDLADQLARHFAGFVDYLALAMSFDPASLWAPGVDRPTTVLVSGGHRLEPPLPAASRTFDVSRVGFLADADVAAVVSGLIRSAVVTGPG